MGDADLRLNIPADELDRIVDDRYSLESKQHTYMTNLIRGFLVTLGSRRQKKDNDFQIFSKPLRIRLGLFGMQCVKRTKATEDGQGISRTAKRKL